MFRLVFQWTLSVHKNRMPSEGERNIEQARMIVLCLEPVPRSSFTRLISFLSFQTWLPMPKWVFRLSYNNLFVSTSREILQSFRIPTVGAFSEIVMRRLFSWYEHRLKFNYANRERDFNHAEIHDPRYVGGFSIYPPIQAFSSLVVPGDQVFKHLFIYLYDTCAP